MNQINSSDRIKASPAARRVAKELGIDLLDVIGSGMDGRIQLEDVENHHQQIKEEAKESITQTEVAQVEPAPIVEQQPPESVTIESIDYEFEPELESTEEPTPQPEEAINQAEFPPTPPAEEVNLVETATSDQVQPGQQAQSEQQEISEKADEDEELPTSIGLSFSDDAEYTFIPSIPINISMQVETLSVETMLNALNIDLADGLIPTVVKAAGAALQKIESPLYEGKINLVTIDQQELQVRTAVDICCSKISEITFIEESEEPVLINIWDMTPFHFSKISKLDTDSINLFLMRQGSTLTIDLTCDEYVLDILEAAIFMDSLSSFINNPSYMLV